jgi:hypothetical protein
MVFQETNDLSYFTRGSSDFINASSIIVRLEEDANKEIAPVHHELEKIKESTTKVQVLSHLRNVKHKFQYHQL